jgi:hypothetical protein
MKVENTYIFILICGCFFLDAGSTVAFTENDKYLWIEMENAERLRDGSLSLKLNLYFGNYPDKKEPAGKLKELKAFYIKKGLGKSSSVGCYRATILSSNGSCFLNIKSPDENSYILYVNGVSIKGNRKYNYYAKTTFALFGKSSNIDTMDIPADTSHMNRQFEVMAVPEFHYWPQTGSPIKISASFNGSPKTLNSIYIHDEHNSAIHIMSNNNDDISYTPPEDNELNKRGSTVFKHTIVTVTHSESGDKYIASRTFIFHRSRYGNYRNGIGGILFGLTLAGFFISIYFIRKRSAF